MKILILKPSSLGDVIQALPVLRLLKQHQPDAQIYWWVERRLAPLLEEDPDLTGLIHFERQRWVSPRYWPEVWQSLQAIRAHRFDWVLDLQSLARSGIVAWLANGRLTVGLDDAREAAPGFYDLIVPRPSAQAHAVDWYLNVLRTLNVPVRERYVWLPERPAAAAAVRAKWPPGDARWIVLHPGARWLNKRWPAEHFAALAPEIAEARPDVRFAILGAASDRELGQRIAQACPAACLDLTGQTSLSEMIEWIRLSHLVVTSDSGPMHVAAALGKPLVAIFGPTSPQRTGPYGRLHEVVQSDLPCVPCLKDYCVRAQPLECLHVLTPAMIRERVLQRLG